MTILDENLEVNLQRITEELKFKLTFRTLFRPAAAIFEEPPVEGGAGATSRLLDVLELMAAIGLPPYAQLPPSCEAPFCPSEVSHTDSAFPPSERPMTIRPRAARVCRR
jgi:hypothetical protein